MNVMKLWFYVEPFQTVLSKVVRPKATLQLSEHQKIGAFPIPPGIPQKVEGLKMLHVHGHKLVLAHAKAVLGSSFHCVDAVTGVHALDEGGLAGILRVHHSVVAGLVQSHGIR